MRLMRTILLSGVLTVAILSVFIYSSCKKNHCHNVVCQNEGVCDAGTCICPRGYEGSRCETLIRAKMINTYNGSDSCGNFNGHTYEQYPIRLTAMLADSAEMTMKGILNNLYDSATCTIITTDSFYFTGLNNSTTYYGSGKIIHDSIWLNYHVQHDTTSYDCHYFGISFH